MSHTDYYDLLGVSSSATPEEIKKAYKQKARQHHPDKNPDDPTAHEAFQRIGTAYEVLSSPNDRASYDAHGPSLRPEPGDMSDMFGGFSERPGPRQGAPTDLRYDITLAEAYLGKRVVLELQRDRFCSHCKGTGGRKGADKVPCAECGGKGRRKEVKQMGPLRMHTMVECTRCFGSGQWWTDPCKKCHGTSVTKARRRVDLVIEPGTTHSRRIIIPGEGDEGPNKLPSDVRFTIHVAPHPLFTPRPAPLGDDLCVTLRITLAEALLGFNRVFFVHLDGRGLRIRSDKGQRVIRHGDELAVYTEGMPRYGSKRKEDYGDLRIKFEVEMPDASWAAREEDGATVVRLPKPPGDVEPLPERVETVYLAKVRNHRAGGWSR